MATQATAQATQAQATQASGTASIYAKLVMVQEALKAPKDAYNGFGGYSYRSAESILTKVKPLLAQYGLAVLCSDEIVQVSDRFYVKATVMLIDADTGATISTSALAREPQDRKGSDQAQVTGASSSYARKYALSGLLGISDAADDPDTRDNRDQGRGPQNGQQQRQGQQQRPPQRQQGQRQMQQQRPMQMQPQPVQQQRPMQGQPPMQQQGPQPVQQRPQLPDPAEDLKAGVRTQATIEKIQSIIDRYPERHLMDQIKTLYKVGDLKEMNEQLAKKCLGTLEKCEAAWKQMQEGGAA